MRVLMYSPDSIGLGHMRRNGTIAKEIVRQRPTASVALLVGSGAGAFFSVPKGIDTIKLPSVQKVAAETWVARSLNITAHETCAMRAGIIRDVVHAMKPDVLVVDHLPMGVGGELKPALQLIRERGMATKTVLGLRDILDEPELIRKRWHQQGFYSFIRERYQRVFIYGDRQVFASGEAYGLEQAVPGRVDYVGYVCCADGGRQTLGRNVHPTMLDGLAAWKEGEQIIVAAGGGGNDAYPMLTATLEALTKLDGDGTHRAVIIGGPLMPAAERDQLAEQARGLKRTIFLPWTADCLDYISKADVAVVMAGYNSTLEALSCRAQIVMAPRAGPSAEQRMRAQMLAEGGHVIHIAPEDAGADRFEAAIRTALAKGPRTTPMQGLNGAEHAARVLLGLDNEKSREPRDVNIVHNRYVVF